MEKIKKLVKCDRCGGRGFYAVGVHNGQLVIARPDNGVCYKCGGSGMMQVTETIRTPEEQARYEKAKARREAKAQAKREAEEAARKEAQRIAEISIPVLRGEVQQHPYVMPDSSIFQNTFSRIDYNPIMHSVHFLYKISKTLILCLVRVSHTFHVCL